jgi:hypothetical protein
LAIEEFAWDLEGKRESKDHYFQKVTMVRITVTEVPVDPHLFFLSSTVFHLSF